ncbi:interleukin-1 receptor-associated kinase 4-like [Uloborus diversus]|uniref:interleukin-1 receptor-associated kinase 4-like n=1 Tax=Uloborus diversus TaxID=327109 RepID=UPI0024098BD9|nr:interleukin-1 receptor-associated kinase 4-like [Uloborus diversus]
MSTNSSVAGDITLDTKIWKLNFGTRNRINDLLNESDNWKSLAEVITDPDNPDKLLFRAQDINNLELQWRRGSSPAGALIEHWSQRGVDQPKLRDLLDFFQKANLFHVARLIKKEVLFENNLEDEVVEETVVDLSVGKVEAEKSSTDPLEGGSIKGTIDGFDLKDITECNYSELSRATQNFLDKDIREGGCKIGEGSFGQVFRACLFGKLLAVKRLQSSMPNQFFTELKILQKYKHENLLPLLGISVDGPYCCLIYEYIDNGSLQERLACIDNSPPILCDTRMSIAYGSALGINHLHTFQKPPMVHRDIKSANILLDKNFIPKIGDFGLVRTGDSTASSTMPVTEHVCGTTIYMAHEAFYGDVSVKLDTFSFGVVLLELLTGLPPYDKSREDQDLISFMENYEDILEVLDPKILWDTSSAKKLYEISQRCLLKSKKKRPEISEILEDLKQCYVVHHEKKAS